MKKISVIVLSLVMALGITNMVLADKGNNGTFAAKKGATIYVCGCGESCTCGTLGKNDGTCGCGQKLIKTTATKVDKGNVYYKLNGKELSAPVSGKYKCGCGDSCNCGFVSQQPGKCGCSKDMVKIKK